MHQVHPNLHRSKVNDVFGWAPGSSEQMADSRKRLCLSQAKKGLVEGLTKLMHDAAGELVTSALIESPCQRAA